MSFMNKIDNYYSKVCVCVSVCSITIVCLFVFKKSNIIPGALGVNLVLKLREKN